MGGWMASGPALEAEEEVGNSCDEEGQTLAPTDTRERLLPHTCDGFHR